MPHALIIEDQFLIATTIADELRECGYDTADIAVSEEEAIQFAESSCPDLITVDQRLASGSGISAIRHICRDRAIPVIWVTGVATEVRNIVSDAVILEKPFSHQALCRAVQDAVLNARVYS